MHTSHVRFGSLHVTHQSSPAKATVEYRADSSPDIFVNGQKVGQDDELKNGTLGRLRRIMSSDFKRNPDWAAMELVFDTSNLLKNTQATDTVKDYFQRGVGQSLEGFQAMCRVTSNPDAVHNGNVTYELSGMPGT